MQPTLELSIYGVRPNELKWFTSFESPLEKSYGLGGSIFYIHYTNLHFKYLF